MMFWRGAVRMACGGRRARRGVGHRHRGDALDEPHVDTSGLKTEVWTATVLSVAAGIEVVAEASTGAESARCLVISPKMANHVSNNFAKLQVADRSEAIVRAGKPVWANAADRRP